MKKILLAGLAGIVLGLSIPAAGAPGGRPRACDDLVRLEYVNHDRAFRALQDLLAPPEPHVIRAALRLQRVSDTWITFDRLAKACAKPF